MELLPSVESEKLMLPVTLEHRNDTFPISLAFKLSLSDLGILNSRQLFWS